MIDEAALDRAVRRFPGILEAARQVGVWPVWDRVAEAYLTICAEYRRIVAKE